MASKTLYSTRRGPLARVADTRNRAGGAAYRTSPKHALAQYAATGCTSTTFYASAERQLSDVIALAYENEPRFVAQTARRRGTWWSSSPTTSRGPIPASVAERR